MLKNIKTFTLILAAALFMAFPAVAEEAAHGGGLPQFNTATWPSQLFWLTIFFVTMYFVFSKSVLPALGGTIENRTNYIGENLKKAETLSREAEALRKEVDASLKSAEQNASQEIASVTNQSKEKLDAALKQFRAHQESEITATETRIQNATQSAMAEMEQIVVSLASQAAEKLAGIPAAESGAEGVVKSLGRKVA